MRPSGPEQAHERPARTRPGHTGPGLQRQLSASHLPNTWALLTPPPEPLEAWAPVMRLAVENAELTAALSESRRDLVNARARITVASDRARRTLERDLHDGAQQRLTAVLIKVGMVQERAVDEGLAGELESISADVRLAIDELRALARGVYPAVLVDQGLADAVRSLALRAPVLTGVIDEGIGRCSPPVEAAVYFCVSEAVQNAIKHAGGGATITVVLRRGPSGDIQFEVSDDGVGMTKPVQAGGIGLMSMRDRIGAVGGELEISSAVGGGASVRGAVPDDRNSQAPVASLCHLDSLRGSSPRPHRPSRDRAPA